MTDKCSECNVPIVPMQATKTNRNNGKPLCTKCEEKINTALAESQLPKTAIFEQAGYEVVNMIARRKINEIDVGLNIAKLQAGKPDLEIVDIAGYPWDRKENPKVSALIDYELDKFKKLLKTDMKSQQSVSSQLPPEHKETPKFESKKPEAKPMSNEPKDPPKKIIPCTLCGIEITAKRALDCREQEIPVCCDSCEEKLPKKVPEPELPKVPANIPKNIPASAPTAQPSANTPDVFKKGSTYNVSGKKAPDAALTQQAANKAGINIQIIAAFQDNEHAFVHVRASLGNQFQEDVVNHDFALMKEVVLLDLIQDADKYHKTIISGFDDDGKPKLTSDAQQKLYSRWIRMKYFSLRDAITKASRRAQMKLLNIDDRDADELDAEHMEDRTIKGGS